MFPTTSFSDLSLRGKLSLLALLTAAVLANLFPFTVPLVMLYLPASIFTYLILRLYGIPWAAVAAVASSLVVPLSVGHPYAVIWYILELAFAVWFCEQRKHNNMIFAVAIYWITIGAPLVFLSFYLLGVGPQVGLLIAAKNCVNGMANVTLACLLYQLLPLQKWLLNKPQECRFPLSQHLFSLMLGFLIIPAVPLLISHLQGSIDQMETRISQELNDKALAVTGHIELLHEQLAGQKTGRALLLEQLQLHWAKMAAEESDGALTLLNYDQVLLSSSTKQKPGSSFKPDRDADLLAVPGGAIHRLPHATRLFMPIAGRWRQSSYLMIKEVAAIPGWRLVVEKPVKPFLSDLRRVAIRDFLLLILFSYPALLLASMVTRRIADPLHELSHLTSDLPAKLQEASLQLRWPESRIHEIHDLNENSQKMAASLQQGFAELRDAKLHLEERVSTRTEQLSQANQALAKSEQRYQTLAESAPVGIFHVNSRGRCIYVNERWCQMVGLTQQQALNTDWNKQLYEADRYKVLSAWNRMLSEGQPFQLEFRIDHPLTGPSWVFGQATLQRDAQGSGCDIIGTITDINARIVNEQQLRDNEQHLNFLAHHDALTGLPNRLLFMDRLEHALALATRNSTQLGLLFLDLDRFKQINDSHGHDCGDRLLQTIAERLSDCSRQSDTIARYGGDEFILLVERVDDIERLATLAGKILRRLAKPVELNHQVDYTTASIGISIYPQDGSNSEELLKAADNAMYRAKQLGRNSFQFYNAEMAVHSATNAPPPS